MKMLKTYYIILLYAVLSFSAAAQNSGIYWRSLNEKSNRLQGKLTGETYFINSLANSNFFLHKEMLYAQIKLEDGDIFEDVKVRLLVYNNELIAYNDNLRTLLTLDKNKIREFTIFQENKPSRKFTKLFFNGFLEGDRYFEELFNGKQSLLAFHFIESLKVTPFTDKSGVLSDTQYKLKTTYYLYSENNNFTKIRAKRHSFYKALPNHKKEIKKIFRKNKITISDETSMVKALAAIDKAGFLN